MTLKRKNNLSIVSTVVIFMMLFGVTIFNAQKVSACLPPCPVDSASAFAMVPTPHLFVAPFIPPLINLHIKAHNVWMGTQIIDQMMVRPMAMMAEQLSAGAHQQSFVVGKFFDAKEFKEARRTQQLLKTKAIRDYHPSHEFCAFGTAARAMAASDSQSDFTKSVLDQVTLSRHVAQKDLSSAGGPGRDVYDRWTQFAGLYCDRRNNGWNANAAMTSGLLLACQNGTAASPTIPERINRDVDFGRLVDQAKTIDIDFENGTLDNKGFEEDILALSRNLYGHILPSTLGYNFGEEGDVSNYMKLRSVIAKRNVAQNSFNAIVSLKTKGTSLGSLPKVLGMNEFEITNQIGEDPSLYAQLEIIAKKLFQNPDFYAGLYDKPANVERGAAAIRALEVMVEREIYESRLRQEMLASVLLSTKIDNKADFITGGGQ